MQVCDCDDDDSDDSSQLTLHKGVNYSIIQLTVVGSGAAVTLKSKKKHFCHNDGGIAQACYYR